MNRFTVEPAAFEKLPDYCVGVVVARGLPAMWTAGTISLTLNDT